MTITMPPRLRQATLMAHVVTSVGWLGAASAFLVVALIGLTSADALTVRGSYLVMDQGARLALVPLAVASLVTGILQSLGTAWGLLRHYWVLFKLVLTALATGVLLMYLQTFETLAAAAANPAVDLDAVRNASPVLHAAAAVLLLLVVTALGVYKPRGLTPLGWRHRQRPRDR